MTNDEHRIEHHPGQSRFALYTGDTLAAFADYTDSDGVRDFDHTVTQPQFRGHGLAAEVVRHALDTTRSEGLKIAASCWYVAKFLDANPEYRN
ncbi:GNAT family acetyltraansferase [Rhodococcus ruber Chol-4]|uniref:GNAT family acetyltransferase n=1 Tax=Rhodococcus ruber TaxID=1830 RepID=A0A098BWM2_9NOCA|nr:MULTISPECIES: GNAT family N-acetyltransferase [Rhodococcus]MDO2379304.1 GNAT family N-acetyltransferase [Rhodococcus ruber]RIK13160.1 MAG: N-acetyltransferase [Acidobacteriota bacterium]ATQ31651.1 N-acetyltransferase [Rhodococcus ruber]AUM15815.1 N-acetyltransferase [Rhodococcus ruber]AWG98570.1 N-acetyltransferase [Rhodococcus ruber]